MEWALNGVLSQVQITGFTVSSGLPHTTVELLHLHSTNQSSTSHIALPPPKPPYFIDVGHSASFCVNVTRPTSKGTFSGEVLVHTSFDKVLHIPVYYKTSMGGLKVSPQFVEFEPTFPYGVSKVPLYVTNLYHHPVTVSSVRREPQDPRFTLEEQAEHSHLKPKETAQVCTEYGSFRRGGWGWMSFVILTPLRSCDTRLPPVYPTLHLLAKFLYTDLQVLCHVETSSIHVLFHAMDLFGYPELPLYLT